MEVVRSNLGWRSSWRMVLWAGAIHCCLHAAQAQNPIPIEVKPANPMETQEVLFSVPDPPADTIFCTWSRQSTEGKSEAILTLLIQQSVTQNGPAFTGRETIYPDCSLRITQLKLTDQTNYIVSVGGLLATNMGNVNLTVDEFVVPPVVTITPTPFLTEGQGVVLRCDTTITKQVSWLKNQVPLDDDHDFSDDNRTLTFDSVTRHDTGEYQCEVSNLVTSVKSQPKYISVIYGPEVPVIDPTDVCNEEHQSIVLSCHAASFPQPLYAWFRDGARVDNGSKLVIKSFDESHVGAYVCEAVNELLQNRMRSGVQQIRLEKSCVSDVIIQNSSDGTEGEPISLHCSAGGDNVSYSWTKGNQPVHADSHISLNNSNQTLEFDPCQRSDAGDYKCHASNSFSFGESAPRRLNIIYGPDPPFINETIDAKLDVVTLTCVAVSYPPTANLWLFNGVQINGEVLTLGIAQENSGNYTCQATNPTSGAKSETTLEIDMIGRLETLKRR